MLKGSSPMNRTSLSLALFALLLGAPTACNRGSTKNSATGTISESQIVVALVGKQPITLGDIDKQAGRELFEVREKALESVINDRVIGAAAKQAGQSTDDFMRKQVEARVPLMSVEEAKTWFEGNKARLPNGLGDKPFDEIKDMIVQGLTSEKRRDAVGALIEEMKTKAGVQVLLRAPKVEVAADGPAKGPQTAKVTIVEFSDFQCPFCSRGKKVVDEVVQKYGDKVRVVFRDFPLEFHDKAQKAAEAGHCAQDQGKFWQMHDWMVDNQDKLDVDSLKTGAKGLGIDSAKFDQCLTSGQHAEAVKRDMRDGQKVGVRGTPAFFINGVMLSGAQPFEKFKAEIDRALAD
jgi:protein-disulfide isomerase